MKEAKSQFEEKAFQHNINYFRESIQLNKQAEKDSNLFSMRFKEDLSKEKPRLLTGKLPEAFKLTSHNQKGPTSLKTETKCSARHSTSRKENTQEPFSSDNSDSDKQLSAKNKDRYSARTRTRTESDETDDRSLSKKAIALRGITDNYCKAQTIENKAPASQEFSKDNAFLRQRANRTIGSTKTYALFRPFSIEDSSADHQLNKKYALEDGFSYFTSSYGYKHYLYLPSIELFLLKEIQFDSGMIEQFKAWRLLHESNASFLRIFQHFINKPEGGVTILLEHPFGFNLCNIVNSIGMFDRYLLNKLAKDCLKFLSEYNKAANKDYGLFCLCDLFYDNDGRLRVIPNILQSQTSLHSSLCECKQFIRKMARRVEMPITQSLSLGVILLKCAIGNIPLKCFDLLFNTKQVAVKCCLLHTLLSLEKNQIDPNAALRLSHFLSRLPESFTQFLCTLLSITQPNTLSAFSHPWLIQITIRPNISLHMKELLKIVTEASPHPPQLNNFLTSFSMVFTNSSSFPSLASFLSSFALKANVISSISHLFDIEPPYLIGKLHVNNKAV